jgi:hypothetical protein
VFNPEEAGVFIPSCVGETSPNEMKEFVNQDESKLFGIE